MVCKENVVSWFGNLTSYKRIDVMVTMLNMCLPFEVRYLGTCIEDRGKRDYNDLRDTEHHANNITDLTEVTNIGIKETRTRRKLILYIALLNSCNYQCATLLYKSLSNFDTQEITNLLSNNHDEQPLEELLLLYTMALNHPAFTYEQKTAFGNIYLKLQEEETKINLQKPNNSSYNKSSTNERTETTEINNSPAIQQHQQHQQQQSQHYSGDIHMRNNAVPPGLTMPPPGLGLPSTEIPINVTNNPGQFVHLGFPAVNSVAPWQTQNMMVGNQIMYHTGGDMLTTYPVSPLVSRQSSPSQSRSPSRSNSPMGRRNNTLRWSSSASSFDERGGQQQQQQSVQTNQSSSSALSISGNNVTNNQNNCTGTVYPTSSTGICGGGSGGGGNRNVNSQQQNQLSTRTAPPPPPPPLNSSSGYLRHNSLDNATASGGGIATKHPPPPRLRSSVSSDTLRETLGKEMPNFKGNLQNFSLEEIRRMSDDDLRDIGLTPNAVGQLRNIVRGQVNSNGLNQIGSGDNNKKENLSNSIHTTVTEQSETESGQGADTTDNVNPNSKVSLPVQEIHPPPPHHHHHHHHHHHNNNNNNNNSNNNSNSNANNNHPANLPNMRRYPTMPPPVDPIQIPIYHPPPTAMYATQNPCYACLTVPIAGMPNRYPRCSAQHMYCVAQLSALKLESDNSRHYSQSSSSDSTGSRSPPETPPAAPWTATNNSSTVNIDNCPSVGAINEHNNASSSSSGSNSAPPYSTVVASHQNSLSSAQQQQQQQQQQIIERPRRTGKNHGHMMRQKNQLMNGGGGGNNGGGPPPNLTHCVSAFPVPTSHPQMTFLPQSHFSALRGPNSAIYTSGYPHSVYTRPFQPNYQQNGEIMYSYTGQPGGGTPPPPPPPPPVSVAAIGVGLPSQSYMTTTQTVNYTPATVQQQQQQQQQQQNKISCYNCGSCSHIAIDCKDQSMEDLTKRAQYRLDYTIMKQPGDCPNNDE